MNNLSASNQILNLWDRIYELNNTISIFHQWEELEKSGCINNFRIVSGQIKGFREGWVFSDSDAYKWLDAASKIYGQTKDLTLLNKIDLIIQLIKSAQTEDGYINTYNQFHFPSDRWVNLQIEHELYCLGHLIEACISHYKIFADLQVLAIATRVADLLVRDFKGKSPLFCDGHEEIEIALIKLFEVTHNSAYIDLAQQFIYSRGKDAFYGLQTHFQKQSSLRRKKTIEKKRKTYLRENPNSHFSILPPDNASVNPPFAQLKRKLEELNGKYFQQHLPVNQQFEPVGHSVRFGYLQTAVARLQRHRQDDRLHKTQTVCWQRMVSKKMFVTGGLGSFSWNEGFGKDYELDPALAYNETCAAIASILWSQQLGELTNQAMYFDLIEWQIYNAMLIGLGMNGRSYLYNNPLEVDIDIQRREWYSVPCCPPNLSRTLSELNQNSFHSIEQGLFIDQYQPAVSSKHALIEINSTFPFSGKVEIRLLPAAKDVQKISLRIPSWVMEGANPQIFLEGNQIPLAKKDVIGYEPTASGYDPRISTYLELPIEPQKYKQFNIEFPMDIRLRYAHPMVMGHATKVAVTRGPIVYCLESVDNPSLDIFKVVINPNSLKPVPKKIFDVEIVILEGKTIEEEYITMIPYFLWGNRGRSKMTVWINYQ